MDHKIIKYAVNCACARGKSPHFDFRIYYKNHLKVNLLLSASKRHTVQH